jgi:7-carboxy-7-deazaguanine synthase
MNAKIIEIFRSIQGEGKYVGAAQVFVRFFECNMHCTWCDTPGSIGDTTRNYKEMSQEQLLAQIKPLYEGCHSVSITGGEPLLQVDFLKEFLPALHRRGMKVYLETNGVLPQQLSEVIDVVDYIAMDIKLPSSTKEKAFWIEHEEFLNIALNRDTFIKVVITTDTTEEDVLHAVDIVERINPDLLFILQPSFQDMKKGVIEHCEQLQKKCFKRLPNVRIMPQMHKFMKLR